MVLNPNFFLPGTDHSLKVQSRMEDKVRNTNLKSLLAFFGKFSRVAHFSAVEDGLGKFLKLIEASFTAQI